MTSVIVSLAVLALLMLILVIGIAAFLPDKKRNNDDEK